jgi:hypothetical protein
MRSTAHSGDNTVPHWIEVNVIDMPLEIPVVANRVLPIAALPERRLPASATGDCNPGIPSVADPFFNVTPEFTAFNPG